MATKLTPEMLAELDALRRTNDVVGKSFLWRAHWHMSGYRTLARRGLVTWDDPPDGFDKRKFAGVEITEAGRAALSNQGGPDQ